MRVQAFLSVTGACSVPFCVHVRAHLPVFFIPNPRAAVSRESLSARECTKLLGWQKCARCWCRSMRGRGDGKKVHDRRNDGYAQRVMGSFLRRSTSHGVPLLGGSAALLHYNQHINTFKNFEIPIGREARCSSTLAGR